MSFVRYNRAPSNRLGPSNGLSNTFNFSLGTETLTIGLTQAPSPKLVNEIRLNGSRQFGAQQYVINGTGGAQRPSDSLFFPPGYSSNDSSVSFAIAPSPFLSLGFDGREDSRQLQIVDNLSWSLGVHQFKAGVDYRWFSPVTTLGRFGSHFYFSGLYGRSGAYFGTIPAVLLVTAEIPRTAFIVEAFSAYVQDTWKARRGAHANVRIAVGSRSGAPGERRTSCDRRRNHKSGQCFDGSLCAIRKTVLRYLLVEFRAATGNWLADA